MRRVDRTKTVSRATSVDGNLTDDGDDTRSQGSGSKKRQHRTIEEREADYNKARSRIFMDFEEKEASISSSGAISSAASAVSFTGGSAGMSSIDGDGASTAPTESEYSGPAGRGNETWYTGTYSRGKPNNGQAASSASLRSNAVPFSNQNVVSPPAGASNYISEPTMHSEGQTSSPQQAPPAPAPASFPAFSQPIYQYYVPLYYPMPYVQQGPPPGHQVGPGQPLVDQPQQQPPAQSGYLPPQTYPGYVWMPAPPPGFIPIPSSGMMPQPPPPPPQHESTHRPPSRPSSQASHQSHSSFDSRPPMHPPPPPQPAVPQQFGGHVPPYAGHTPQQPPHQSLHPISPNQRSASLMQTPPRGPPSSHRNDLQNYNQLQQPHQPWSQRPPNPMPLTGRGPNVPHSGPGRPALPMTSSIGPPSSIPGAPKRGPSRPAWGNNSYGPGVSYGEKGTQLGPIGPAGGILRVPDVLNIRVLPPITHDAQSIASSSSGGSLRKRGTPSSGVKSSGDEASSVTVSWPFNPGSSANRSSSLLVRLPPSGLSHQPRRPNLNILYRKDRTGRLVRDPNREVLEEKVPLAAWHATSCNLARRLPTSPFQSFNRATSPLARARCPAETVWQESFHH